MKTWRFIYIRDSEGNYIPWLDRVDNYAPCTTTETVWSLELYSYFPRKREQKNTITPNHKESEHGHTSNT